MRTRRWQTSRQGRELLRSELGPQKGADVGRFHRPGNKHAAPTATRAGSSSFVRRTLFGRHQSGPAPFRDGEKTALHFQQAAFVPRVGDTGAPPMETVGGVGRGDLAQPHTNQRGEFEFCLQRSNETSALKFRLHEKMRTNKRTHSPQQTTYAPKTLPDATCVGSSSYVASFLVDPAFRDGPEFDNRNGKWRDA
ncbi:hypothetical protein MRX96_013690 [Rhipicephalus microplus]